MLVHVSTLVLSASCRAFVVHASLQLAPKSSVRVSPFSTGFTQRKQGAGPLPPSPYTALPAVIASSSFASPPM